ncbi:MAG: trypsin-like peptidase domain-containing protein [Butyrivibrio sp.]|nr:trypsin-like peptidase domain-containing protein [Butyrivibrio sp.]
MTDELPEDKADIMTAYEKIFPSLVRISSGDYLGSGNIWAITVNKIKIITASHVAAEDTCTVTFFDGVTCDGTLSYRDEAKDIAIIEVDITNMPDIKEKAATPYRSVRPSDKLPMYEEKVFIIDSLSDSASIGFVEDPNVFNPLSEQNVIYCICEVGEGMSGSGLFDANGHYHGILLEKSDDTCICLAVENFNIPKQ